MRPPRHHGERGHVMAALMAAIAIMMIFSTVVFQAWEDLLRRENEAEMIFRGQEISRAIYRFRLDRQEVPRTLDDLLKPGPRGQYYLRHAYRDPLVKDGVWGLLFLGPDGSIIGGEVSPERNLGFGEGGDVVDDRRGLGFGPGMEEPMDRPGERFAAEQRGAAGRIAGVRTLATDEPFRVYKGFSDYSQWQFTYLDYEETATPGGRPGRGGRQNQRPGDLGQFGLPPDRGGGDSFGGDDDDR